MAKKALGKGLNAIISSSSIPIEELENQLTEDKDKIVSIDIDKIKPNPDQPRTNFNEKEISELADSIKSVGLLQPIIVRKENDKYYIIAGERRFRALKKAGKKKAKAIIFEVNKEENILLALIENLQRSDLNPIDEAKAYKTLSARFKLKQQDIAKKVGKDRATVANIIRLLNLPDEIQEAIKNSKITVGHAKELLALSGKKQMELYKEITQKGLSVRELEKMVNSEKPSKSSKNKAGKSKNAHIKDIENNLISVLGTKVEIKHSKNKGKIEIFYYSLDDFERIIELIQ